MTLHRGEGEEEVGREGRERRSRVGSDRGKTVGRRCRGRRGGWAEKTVGEGGVNLLQRVFGGGGASVEKEEDGCVFSQTLVYIQTGSACFPVRCG